MAYRSRRERKRSPSVEKILHEHRAAGGKTRDHSAGDALVEGKEARKHMGKRARGYSEAHETTPPYGIEPKLLARGGANVPCDEDEQQEAKRGGGIHIKKSHRGLLHEKMGIAKDKPISTGALEKEKRGADKKERKEIQFAINARHFHHGG